MEKLAKHFKGLENLAFARIDASVNEHPKLQVSYTRGIYICIPSKFSSYEHLLLYVTLYRLRTIQHFCSTLLRTSRTRYLFV